MHTAAAAAERYGPARVQGHRGRCFRAERGHRQLGSAYVPADRVSARGYASFAEATVITVPAEAVASRPTVISVRGAGAAFGHELELEPERQRGGHVRSPRQRATRPGELAIDGGTQSRCYTAAQASGSRVPSIAARATSVRRRLLLRGVGPQPGERLGQIDVGALADHAFGLLDHHPAGQGAGELLVQALGLGAGAMLHDAEGGKVSKGPGDDDVRLVHRCPRDAEQVQGTDGDVTQPQRQGGRRREAGLEGGG